MTVFTSVVSRGRCPGAVVSHQVSEPILRKARKEVSALVRGSASTVFKPLEGGTTCVVTGWWLQPVRSHSVAAASTLKSI
jgi:hypothetical protein